MCHNIGEGGNSVSGCLLVLDHGFLLERRIEEQRFSVCALFFVVLALLVNGSERLNNSLITYIVTVDNRENSCG